MEGYDPATKVLLFNGRIIRLDELQMADVLMGPDGTPRHIVRLQQVDNVDGVNLYDLVLAWNQTPLILTMKTVQVIMNFAPYTTLQPGGTRRSDAIRARYFNGEQIASRRFAIRSPYTPVYYETPELATEAADRFLQLYRGPNAPVPVHSEFAYPLAEILRHNSVQQREKFPLFFTDGLQFEARPVPVDAYFLGLWLGDGEKHYTTICNKNDEEIVAYLQNYADFLGMRLTRDPVNIKYNIVKALPDDPRTRMQNVPNFNAPFIQDGPSVRENKLLRELRNIGVTRLHVPVGAANDMKHIPDLYKFNSREIRLELLAGLIDSDGHYEGISHRFMFSQSVIRHTRLFNDVVWLARSLGFYCSLPVRSWSHNPHGQQDVERWKTDIYGDLNQVRSRLPRKQPRERATVRIARAIGIRSFRRLRPGPFVDIQTDQDNLFLRGDFLVLRGSDDPQMEEVEEVVTDVVDGFDASEINQLQALSQALSSQEEVATFGAADFQVLVDSQESQDEDDLYLKYLRTLQAEEDDQMELDPTTAEAAGPSRPIIRRPAIATQAQELEEAVSSRTRSKGKGRAPGQRPATEELEEAVSSRTRSKDKGRAPGQRSGE